MAFRWIVSRIVRLFAQKTNSLFYLLMYREIQNEILVLAEKMGVTPAELSKEIGRRAAKESAERHANILGLVPVNPKNPKKIVAYIETLWFILFGNKLEDYEIEADVGPDGKQRVTFKIKKCPVCMGYKEDLAEYKEMYNAFSRDRGEGYACLMAGMLEELATIIMENKQMDIRMDIRETRCYARGDDIMAVEATVVPAEEFYARKGIALEITTPSPEVGTSMGVGAGLESIAGQSSRLFEQVAESLKLEQLDEFFDTPVDSIKEKLAEFVEQQLHFSPADILVYFKNYEEDVFRVIGYLAVHAINEAGAIVEQVATNTILNRVLDIFLEGLEYGLQNYIPEKIERDNKEILLAMMEGWVEEDSYRAFQGMETRDMFKLVLEGARLAFQDYGAEFIGAKKATYALIRNSSALQEEKPDQVFNLVFDLFQEAILLAGYLFSIPIKIALSGAYEAVRTPVVSAQDVYKGSREHLERLFDIVEEIKDLDLQSDNERIATELRRNFPRVF